MTDLAAELAERAQALDLLSPAEGRDGRERLATAIAEGRLDAAALARVFGLTATRAREDGRDLEAAQIRLVRLLLERELATPREILDHLPQCRERLGELGAGLARAGIITPAQLERLAQTASGRVPAQGNPQATIATDSAATLALPTQDQSATLALASGPRLASEDVAAGQRLGEYEILQLLGRGGMGAVYLARKEGLSRLVALKLLTGGADDPDARARFHGEAEAAARLRHPGIVPIYDVGEVNGRPYFTMEFIAGRPLDKLLKTDPPPLRQALQYGLEAARALDYAHGQGIIHRDIKPANLMVRDAPEGPEGGRILIADFGLARDLNRQTQLTQTGMTMGTPVYMSPEQARGARSEIGPRSDVYSLGATLYELSCGRPPFGGESVAEVLEQVLSRAPPPPRQQRRDLPRDVETIILRAMEKRPQDRYAGAGALAEDLERFLDQRPILARPVSSLERLWINFQRRSRRSRAAILATPLLLLGAGIWIQAALSRSDLEIRQQKARQEAAEEQKRTADLRRERRQDAARQVSSVQAGVESKDPEVVKKSLEGFDRALAIDPDYTEVLAYRAAAQYRLGKFPEAIADFQQYLAVDPRHLADHQGLVYSELDARAHFLLAWLLVHENQVDESLPHQVHLMELGGSNRAGPEAPLLNLLTRVLSARIALQQGDLSTAQGLSEEVAADPQGAQIAENWLLLGQIYSYSFRGGYDRVTLSDDDRGALFHPRRALYALDRYLAEIPFSVPGLLLRAQLQLDLRRPREAVKDLELALHLEPDNEWANFESAEAHIILGPADPAHFDQAEALARRGLAFDPTRAHKHLTAIYLCRGQLDQAEESLRHLPKEHLFQAMCGLFRSDHQRFAEHMTELVKGNELNELVFRTVLSLLAHPVLHERFIAGIQGIENVFMLPPARKDAVLGLEQALVGHKKFAQLNRNIAGNVALHPELVQAVDGILREKLPFYDRPVPWEGLMVAPRDILLTFRYLAMRRNEAALMAIPGLESAEDLYVRACAQYRIGSGKGASERQVFLRQALEDLDRARQVQPTDKRIRYALATLHALAVVQGDDGASDAAQVHTRKAAEELYAAFEHGFRDMAWIDEDSAFAAVRSDPGIQAARQGRRPGP